MRIDKNTKEFKSWFEWTSKFVKEENRGNYFITIQQGRKFIKIVLNGVDSPHRSAFAFINMNNGDVLMASSWTSPAKGARGNIFDVHNGRKFVTPYGMAYLR